MNRAAHDAACRQAGYAPGQVEYLGPLSMTMAPVDEQSEAEFWRRDDREKYRQGLENEARREREERYGDEW